jgi:hypothetical protein
MTNTASVVIAAQPTPGRLDFRRRHTSQLTTYAPACPAFVLDTMTAVFEPFVDSARGDAQRGLLSKVRARMIAS